MVNNLVILIYPMREFIYTLVKEREVPSMNVYYAIVTRRSTRAYRSEPVRKPLPRTGNEVTWIR